MRNILKILREKREAWTGKQLSRRVSPTGVYRYYWQPPLFVLFKIIVVSVILVRIISFYPYGGDALEAGLRFFKLDKIFNFQFPQRPFFDSISFFLFIILFGFPGVLFYRDQVSALLSTVAVNRNRKKLYYLNNRIIKTETVALPFGEIESVSLKQHIVVGKFLNIGSIEITMRSGETFIISSIGDAERLTRQLMS